MFAGAVLSLIGLADVGLLWVPLNFESTDWQFGTFSGTFDALPLATIGLVVLTVGSIVARRRLLLVPLAIIFFAMAIFLISLLALHILNVLSVWTSVEPSLKTMLGRAVLKTSVQGVAYPLLFGWLGWKAVRSAATRGEYAQ
jgi:hypothetical protein